MKTWEKWYSALLAMIVLVAVAQLFFEPIKPAESQVPGVTVVGAVTAGDCTKFISTLQLSDTGTGCGSAGSFTVAGTGGFTFSNNSGANVLLEVDGISAAANHVGTFPGSTGQPVSVFATGSDTNIPLNVQAKGNSGINFLSNSGLTEVFQVTGSTTAVNFLAVNPGNTGVSPSIVSGGGDATVGLSLTTKAAGSYFFNSNNFGNPLFQINGSTTAANFLTVTPANTLNSPVLSSGGSDTNVSMLLQTKGTSAVNVNSTGGNNGTIQLFGGTSGNNSLSTGATGGHLSLGSSGTAPTLTAGCNGAGSSVTSNNSGGDIHGTVTGQTAAATACTLTFGTAFANAPDCQVMGLTSPLTGTTTITTGGIAVNFASTANYKWTYWCPGI